jgi:septal ring factor EnvC (AmiA/AmiB activator)
MTATDTPRTDAIEFRHCPPQPKELLKKHQDAYALSRELERELAASKAEVNKLTHQLLKTENDLLQSQDINSFLDAEFRIACKRAEKAEAEVERLKSDRVHLITYCANLLEEVEGAKVESQSKINLTGGG